MRSAFIILLASWKFHGIKGHLNSVLPQLQPDETVEQWFNRATLKRVANDSEWLQYQNKVLRMCQPLWDLVTEDKRLSDTDFLELYIRDMPQFGSFIYVPLPWHHIVEQAAMLRKDYEPLKKAAHIFRKLNFVDYDHFITLGQASFRQIRKYCHRGGFSFKHLEKLKIVFTSRLENLDRLAEGERLIPKEIPIPLLYRQDLEIAAEVQPSQKSPSAFFAGSCTCPMRQRLADLATSSHYNMSVSPCGKNKLQRSEYVQDIANSLWTITPRGSFPAAYMMSEAIQSGSLPIYIYGWKDENTTSPLPPIDPLLKHLPFYNAGLDWRDLGLVVTADDIPSLPRLLAKTDPNPRLSLVQRVRPFFTVPGTYQYILTVLSRLAASAAFTTRVLESEFRS